MFQRSMAGSDYYMNSGQVMRKLIRPSKAWSHGSGYAEATIVGIPLPAANRGVAAICGGDQCNAQ